MSITTYTTTATATTATTNVITVTSVENMVRGLPVTFTGTTFGGIIANTTYYILNIVSSTSITVSPVPNGNVFVLTTATGTLTATFTQGGQRIISTVPPGEPLNQAFNAVNLNFDQIFAAGPVLSNIQITNNKISTLDTNGNLVLSPNGIGVVQANAHVVPNQTRIRNLGSSTNKWLNVYSQYITAESANIASFSNLTIGDANLHITGGSNGYVLQTNGSGTLTWVPQTGSGNGSPGGANTEVQFNDAGAFGGSSAFTYNKITETLTVANLDAGNVSGNVASQITSSFNSGDASPWVIATLPAGSIVTGCSMILDEAFDDPSATISVGTAGDHNQLLATADINPMLAGTYSSDIGYKYNTDTEIMLYITPGISTTGSGVIVLDYQ